jgi:hypothetical protein
MEYVMKKVLAAVLATAVGAGALAATAGEASAKQWYPKHYNHHHYYGGPNFAAPFFLGLGLGYLTPRYYPAYPVYPTYGYGPAYGYGNAHVQWCASHYRTYNPATNTFFIRKGVPATCVSPYSY